MTGWKSRSYSKHSDSAGSALKELAGSKPLPNQNRPGNGYGRPSAPLVDPTETDGTREGAPVIYRNRK